MALLPNYSPGLTASSRLKRLRRHTSTALIGESTRKLLRSPLSEHVLPVSKQPSKLLAPNKKNPLKSLRELLGQTKQRTFLKRKPSEKSGKPSKRSKDVTLQLKLKEATLDKVQQQLAQTEEQSKELKLKIQRFESLFCKLCDSLEGSGEDIQFYSKIIEQELDSACTVTPIHETDRPGRTQNIKQELELVKRRTYSLLQFLKLKKKN